MKVSTFLFLSVMTVGCSKAAEVRPTSMTAPACQVVAPEVIEASTTLGKLRASWRVAVQRELATHHEVMSGVRPAYQGFVWFEGQRHGPVFGLVRTDIVHGVVERQLQLAGPTNTSITLVQRTTTQPGAFLIAVPGGLIECSDCLDLASFSLRDEMQFEGRSMELLSVGPQSQQQRVRVTARVELRRLAPARITAELALALFPNLTPVDAGVLTVRTSADVWVPVARPGSVEAGYESCEAMLQQPPVVQLDSACLANWKVDFPSEALTTTCCASPRYHGPSRSGLYPEVCVSVPGVP